MTGEMLLLQVGAAALLYLITKNRMNAYVHPLRMRLADLGAARLADEKLSDRMRSRIEFQLDNAYNGRIAWGLVILMPYAAVRSLIESFVGKEKAERGDSDYSAIMLLSTISVFATSPIAAVLFLIEMLVLGLLFVPLGAALRTMENTLERAEGTLQHRHRLAGQ